MTIDEFEKLNLPDEHYLKIATEQKHNYLQEFLTASDKLKTILKPNDLKTFWYEKMQLHKNVFMEKAFIQGACETAVANHFADKADFGIEVKVNPNNKKDVDCQFKSNGFTYNIEVKCASFDTKEKVENSDSFKFHTFGRMAEREGLIRELSKALDEGLTNQGKPLKEHQELKNMDNNLKDFLELAHEKFNPNCPEDEVNILLVGCNDKSDMQSWFGYLFADEGLFTEDSFADSNKYNNVDIIVLTNLYFKHKDFFKKRVNNSWTLEDTLNFIFYNPLRAREKNAATRNFINSELKNYTMPLQKFEVSGNVPDYVKNAVLVPHFVIDHLENGQGIYLFETKIE
jgi:hypothetical protein